MKGSQDEEAIYAGADRLCPSSGGITCFFVITYGSLRDVCAQLFSEADLPENHGCPNLFLPNHWSRHVKSALLHVISLARLACVHTWKWAAGSLGPRIGQEVVADNTRWNRPRKARSFRRLISAAYTCASQISRPPYSTSTYASCLPRSSPDEEQRKTNPCLLWRRGITISAAGTNTCCDKESAHDPTAKSGPPPPTENPRLWGRGARPAAQPGSSRGRTVRNGRAGAIGPGVGSAAG